VWMRKIIGVFSGSNQDPVNKANVGVRITDRKYMTICYWANGKVEYCKEMLKEQLRRRPYVRTPVKD
jgi:hypothetical protein